MDFCTRNLDEVIIRKYANAVFITFVFAIFVCPFFVCFMSKRIYDDNILWIALIILFFIIVLVIQSLTDIAIPKSCNCRVTSSSYSSEEREKKYNHY